MREKREAIRAFLLILLFYLLLEMGFGIGCPFKFLTGISDAGCGMSRAWRAALHGDFARAFYFHPLWPLPPLALLLWLGQSQMSKKLYRWLMWAIILAFLLVWVVRFFVPGQNIVVFEPWNGVAGRMLRWIYETGNHILSGCIFKS